MTDTSPNPPSSVAALGGRLLAGRYRLGDQLAGGGMAVVWQATDEVLARPVAVKVLHPHLAADDTFVGRFRREAVAAARLAHPAIVSIYDTCSDEGAEAIVMELVRGRTLRDELDQRAPLELDVAVAIAATVADALGVAHAAGVVHRDVKPGNILLSDDGRVMVADFGIAKAADTGDLTQEGTLLGTAKYLAPEQVEGGPVVGRTDVYSLGAVLYEMVCGRPPFVADGDAATALARLHDNPLRPRQVRAGIPRTVEDVVQRAMARRPDDRYRSAAELRSALLAAPTLPASDDALDATAATVGVPHTPPGDAPTLGQSERSWIVPGLLVVLVAVALGVSGILLGRTDAGQDLLRRTRDAVGSDPLPAEPVALVATEAFDPPSTGGDANENDATAGLATDGDADTAWETEGYVDPDVTVLKPGVGLYVVAEGPGPLAEAVVTSPTEGWAAEIYVADQPGATLAEWGEPVTATDGIAAGSTTFDLRGSTGGAVLIWITDLGDGADGNGGRTRARLAEVELREP